ncbi:hypothetical protein EHQ64_00305 [Leptospira sarikeiensis]|uniref:Uncharacterized protein n=2 Tax=Leptospira sarikeiensis TaxID=2484943 RepID=A0A4R9KF11_9LEPT|nr:hypothetical protein EHQ64_00305 [Leptospira sarikeiensis]
MPYRKIVIAAVSLVLITLLVLFFTKQSSPGHPGHSSKNVLEEGLSLFSGFIGSKGSFSGGEEDGIVPASILKNETPDNLYWVAVATPKDPAERKAQVELLEHWATLHGKIYSGKATQKEIDEYFKAQIKLQEDQLELLHILEERYPDRIDDDRRRMITAGKELYSKKLKNVTEEYKKYSNETRERRL